jgi:phosphoesterase RecJ-like protein
MAKVKNSTRKKKLGRRRTRATKPAKVRKHISRRRAPRSSSIPAAPPPPSSIDWTPFVAMVRRHKRFLLTTHIRPDADGLGSMLALAEALQSLGKHVRMLISSTYPPRYFFLDPDRRIERFSPPGDAWRDCDAIVVLDTATWNQLADFGPFLRSLDVAKAVIDHHVSHDNLGAARFVNTNVEATGRLVYEAIEALEAPLSETIADMLFAALAMDTGWFRHSNTTPATFALAEKLVRAGARPTLLYERLFEQNTLGRMKLSGLVLDRLQTSADGRIVWTELHRTDYERTGATPQDSEDLVNYTRSVKGAEVGLFFMEQPAGGVKISLRSRGLVDVAKLAERFGGGGHRLASGVTLQTSLEEARRIITDAIAGALPAPS